MIAALVASVLLVVKNDQIADAVLWAVKVLGALLTVGAGVAGLFSTSAVDKDNRLTPVGVTFIVVIGLGAAASMTAEWIADSAARKQANVVLSTIQLTETDVERQVFPFSDVRFSIELKVNLAHPLFRGLARNLIATANKHRSDFADLRPGDSSLLGGTGVGAQMGDDGQLIMVAYDNSSPLPKIESGDPAAEILYVPDMRFDIYRATRVLPPELTNETTLETARHSDDFTTDLITDTQEEMLFERSQNALGRDLRYRVYFVPSTRACFIDFFGTTPSPGVDLRTTSGSLIGVPDLAGSQFVFRLAGHEPKYWSKSAPLELSEMRMYVGMRQWTIEQSEFSRYVNKLGYLAYAMDVPTDVSTIVSRMRAIPQGTAQGLND